MFVFRALFWFVVVALLMPRGPDLGLDLRHPKGWQDAPSFHVDWNHLAGAGASLGAGMGPIAKAPAGMLEHYREATLRQLALVRSELQADRLRRGEAGTLVSIIPAAWRD